MNRFTRNRLRRRQAGMTIVELLLGTGITGMVLSALILGSSLLQQQFAASTQYAVAQSDQMRAMDYIEMDLRRATSVTLASGATPLTVTLPDYYQTVSGKKQPRVPTKSGTKVTYNTGSVTVSYTLQGNRLVRTEGGVATTIATTVQSFPTPIRTKNSVNVTLSFNFKLRKSGPSKTVTLSSNSLLRNVH